MNYDVNIFILSHTYIYSNVNIFVFSRAYAHSKQSHCALHQHELRCEHLCPISQHELRCEHLCPISPAWITMWTSLSYLTQTFLSSNHIMLCTVVNFGSCWNLVPLMSADVLLAAIGGKKLHLLVCRGKTKTLLKRNPTFSTILETNHKRSKKRGDPSPGVPLLLCALLYMEVAYTLHSRDNNNNNNNVFFSVRFLLRSTRPITWNKIS